MHHRARIVHDRVRFVKSARSHARSARIFCTEPISEQNQININLDQVTIDTPARVIKDFYCEAHSFPPIASYRNNDMNMIYDEKVVITGIHGYRFKCRKENGREGLVPNHVLLVEDE